MLFNKAIHVEGMLVMWNKVTLNQLEMYSCDPMLAHLLMEQLHSKDKGRDAGRLSECIPTELTAISKWVYVQCAVTRNPIFLHSN